VTTSPESMGLTGDPAQPPDGSAEPTPQTPEEVEAIWRNRFSQRDKAHNAEVQSLREQVDALRSAPPSQPPADGSNPDGGYKARWEQTQRELEQERQSRAIDARRAKFSDLAREVPPDDPLWAAAREESLARLNANLTGPAPAPEPTGLIDRNNPRRDTPAAAKPIEQMSKDELLRELERAAPAEEARQREAF
jgi:hypothetical protein